MKKFMFSAVALIAFSVSGMASTGEGKEILKDDLINSVKKTEQVVLKLPKCDQLANDVMDAYEANGYSVEQAYDYGLAAYKDCLKG